MTNVKFDQSVGDQIRTSRFQLQELPAEVAKVVSTMKTGEISNPFLMVNSKGKEVCAVVKLKTHIKAHRASMSEDFQSAEGRSHGQVAGTENQSMDKR